MDLHGFVGICMDLYGFILIQTGLSANASVQIANGLMQIANESVQIANGSVQIANGSVRKHNLSTDSSPVPVRNPGYPV